MKKFLNLFHRQVHITNDYPLILVTGNPKTGTTALYYSIKNALPKNSFCLFEPEHRSLQVPEVISTPVLVKSFIPASKVFDHFTRKILIVRDPRDRLISQMLYRPYNIVVQQRITTEEECEKVLQEMIRLLHQKELDPGKVSVKEIRALLKIDEAEKNNDDLFDYYRNRPDAFLFKYEDYIDGNLKNLSKFLGFKVDITEEVPEKRVIRSKAYGNWKDWFTISDVEFYRPIYNEYMEMFGYQDNWELHNHPVINPSHSSLYVIKLIGEAREKLISKQLKDKGRHN